MDVATTPSLTGLRRRSLCCHAPIAHSRPWESHSYRDIVEIRCTCCRHVIDAFEVVNFRGERIWPLPEGYEIPPDHPLHLLNAIAPVSCRVMAVGRTARMIASLLR